MANETQDHTITEPSPPPLPPMVKIPGIADTVPQDTRSVVVIGPNGSGKTQFGVSLSQENGGANAVERIPALRNIEMSSSINPVAKNEIDANLNSIQHSQLNEYWRIAQDVDWIFRSLIVEHSAAGVYFREQEKKKRNSGELVETKMDRVLSSWSKLFPGRTIDFSSYSPKVSSEYKSTGNYDASRMSDGERAALYLAGRILNTTKKLLVIDEPELHFHNKLAVLFWDEMEALRPDCRFIYSTHDLQFALSRQNPYFIIVRPNAPPELFAVPSELPNDIAKELLSAASLSIYAKRIIFCEGDEKRSKDLRLYHAWFQKRDSIVFPVLNCREVQDCVSAYKAHPVIKGLDVIGIVDRDFLNEEHIAGLVADGVTVLDVHEIESLFCLPSVISAIALHLGISPDVANAEFISNARKHFVGEYKNSLISERFRRRCERIFDIALNKLKVNSSDPEIVKANHIAALEPQAWNTDPKVIFDEELYRVNAAINGDVNEFLEILPGKTILGDAAKAVGLIKDSYITMICNALIEDKTDATLYNLGQELEKALTAYLPPREI